MCLSALCHFPCHESLVGFDAQEVSARSQTGKIHLVVVVLNSLLHQALAKDIVEGCPEDVGLFRHDMKVSCRWVGIYGQLEIRDRIMNACAEREMQSNRGVASVLVGEGLRVVAVFAILDAIPEITVFWCAHRVRDVIDGVDGEVDGIDLGAAVVVQMRNDMVAILVENVAVPRERAAGIDDSVYVLRVHDAEVQRVHLQASVDVSMHGDVSAALREGFPVPIV